jgi:hypothetical protein
MVVLACTLGCKSSKLAPLKKRTSIAVPAGLNANDVEVVVLYELVDKRVPVDLNPGERITDNAMKALFPFRYRRVSEREQSLWYPESVEKGVIYAGYERNGGKHYLRVAIEYTDDAVKIRFVESRGVSQVDNRIHRNAVIWIDQLEVRIRRALGKTATTRALGGRKPK